MFMLYVLAASFMSMDVHDGCPCMFMPHVLAACLCFMSRLHVHASYPCFTSMLHVLVIWPAAYPCCMSMIHLYVHAECPCKMSFPCCISILHSHIDCSFCKSMLLSMLHVRTACPYCMSMLYILDTCPCRTVRLWCMPMSMLHVYAASRVHAHVHAACLWDKNEY